LVSDTNGPIQRSAIGQTGQCLCFCTRLHRKPDASGGVVAHTVRDRCDVFRVGERSDNS